MAEYYGVKRSSEYLEHFGIPGMKWGIRKQRSILGNQGHSSAYNAAKKKLSRATMAGGIVGGLAYAATHKNQMKSIDGSNNGSKKHSKDWYISVDTRSKKRLEANGASRSRIQYHNGPIPKNTKSLYQAAKDAGDRLTKAEAVRDKSFLGRHGFGKTQRAVNVARNEAKQAYSNYYDSLSKKQQRRLRRNHVG